MTYEKAMKIIFSVLPVHPPPHLLQPSTYMRSKISASQEESPHQTWNPLDFGPEFLSLLKSKK